MGRSLAAITIANEQVSIVSVLQMLGVDLPDDVGSSRSRKLSCPFGQVYHSDGGVSPAMRIYPDTNSAYCFSCSMYFTPVSLAAQGLDCDPLTAANRLLDRIGHRPTTLAQKWEQARSYEPEPDKALLADALKTYCRRINPDWAGRQFDPAVAATLTRCLSLLDLVHTAQDVSLWLSRCKVAMCRTLVADVSSVSERHDVLLEAMDVHGEGYA